jgi:hypothetical protein
MRENVVLEPSDMRIIEELLDDGPKCWNML